MPTPASSSVFVSADREITEIQIYATSGELVLRERTTGVGARVDVSTLSPGAYTMLVATSSGMYTRTLLVQR